MSQSSTKLGPLRSAIVTFLVEYFIFWQLQIKLNWNYLPDLEKKHL